MQHLTGGRHPAVVFLPGWGFYSQVWSKVANHFTHKRLLDLPCLPQITLLTVVDHLISYVPDGSVIVAWSLGGVVATELCYRLPHKCRQLILVGTTPRFSADSNWQGVSTALIKGMLTQLKKGDPTIMRDFFRLVPFPSRDSGVRYYLNQYRLNGEFYYQWLHDYLTLLLLTDVRESYRALSQPLLHLLGERDAVVKVSDKQLKQLNPHATIETIAGSGHAPLITHYEEVIIKIKAFLTSCLSIPCQPISEAPLTALQ